MRIGEDPSVDIWIADVSDLALDTNKYIYIYICVCVCVCVCTYMSMGNSLWCTIYIRHGG